MAVQFQTNIKVSIGASFRQEFHLSNNDLSAMNITGCKIYANIAKHPTSLDAVESTSDEVVYNFIPFKTSIVNGAEGVFALTLDSFQSSKLKEGKYVYNAVLEDVNGDRIDTVSGLVFAEMAFGSIPPEDSILDGGSAGAVKDLILDGGGA